MVVVHRWLTLLACSGRGAGCFGRALGQSSCLCFVQGCDPLDEESSIVLDPADQRRAACPLPGEAEEKETWYVGHSATVSQAPVLIDDRKADPRVVGAVAGGPDDRVDLDLVPVVRADRAPSDGRGAWFQFYAITARYLARARADQRVAVFQPLPEARIDGLVDQTGLRQPPEEVTARHPLGKRLLTSAERKND